MTEPRSTSEALWSRPTRSRIYAASRSAPRARRATDVLLLLSSLASLLLLVQLSDPHGSLELALIDVAAAIPSFLDIVWRTSAGLLLLWAALLLGASLVRWRVDILRDLVLSIAGGAAAAALIADHFAPGSPSTVWAALTTTGPPPASVSLRLALAGAVTVAASPHIARPLRATSRWIIGIGSVSLVMLDATTPTGAAIGLLCGTASAAVVHLLLGSSGGRPSLTEVARSLRELGIEPGPLTEAVRQPAGVFLVDATDEHGERLHIKVYGRDAWDAQILAKAWRTLWYRDSDALTLTRLQQVEHEAFITLLAERAGVPVSTVVQAGRTADNDAIIVLRPRGVPLSGDPSDATAAQDAVAACWRTVLALHAAGIAHGDLSPERLRADGPDVVLHDLTRATVSPSGDQRRVDLAQMLVITALLFGVDEAVRGAAAHLERDGLARVLPYLQVAALGPALRTAVRSAELDLDAVRAAAAVAAAAEEPAMAKLQRVSPATALRAAVMVAGAYFLISSLAGIDLARTLEVLRDATWGLLLVALLLGQTPRLTQALATRGACPRPIAYGPLVLLQLGISFVNLVLPSSAARIAVNIRFFQRQGIPPASAVSIGVIDGLTGFVVQVAVLLLVVVFGFGELDMALDPDDLPTGGGLISVLAMLAVAAVAAVLLAALVPSLRTKLLDRVRPWLAEVRETVGSLRSPAKLAQVLGGNVATELLFAITMAVVLASLGVDLPLSTLLVINVSVSLFAGLMPVPGGIGVSEGALILGLTAAGVNEELAFAAAISYRMITFYLPPLWGGVAFRRLEREGYL